MVGSGRFGNAKGRCITNYKRRSNVNRRPNISFYGVSETSKDLIAAMNKKDFRHSILNVVNEI